MNLMNWFLSDKSKSAAEQKYEEDMKYFAAICRICQRAGYKVVVSDVYPKASHRWFAVQLATPETVIVKDFPLYCFKEFNFAEPVSEIKVPVTEGEIFFAPASFVEVNQ